MLDEILVEMFWEWVEKWATIATILFLIGGGAYLIFMVAR
jgi:hypothetical protein